MRPDKTTKRIGEDREVQGEELSPVTFHQELRRGGTSKGESNKAIKLERKLRECGVLRAK